MSCEHLDFEADVAVARLGDDDGQIRNFIADVSIHCRACGQPFHFVGAETGLSFKRPMRNVPGTTLHVPISPGEADIPTGVRFEIGDRSS